VDALSIPSSSLLRLFRSAVISKAERRRRFFSHTIDKEFADIKTTHDTFRSVLTTLYRQLDTLSSKFLENNNKRITSQALGRELNRIFDQAQRKRFPGQTRRRELYEECRAFLDISNPYKGDVLLVFTDDEIDEIHTFMSTITVYFQSYEPNYVHEVSHAMRDVQDLLVTIR
jgi:hypothetical protein